MIRHRELLLAAVAAAVAPIAAQQDPTKKPVYELNYAYGSVESPGDFTETLFHGGFVFRWPDLDLEIRGASGILQSDRSALQQQLAASASQDGPPRRGIEPPAPRRTMTPEAMHERVERFLKALGQSPKPLTEKNRSSYDLPRFLYFEGDVIVVRGGIEVVRCRRLWISPLDDRMVVEGAELRYQTRKRDGGVESFVVRGDRLEKQGARWTGRDLTFTSCDAGKPHIAVLSGELEIVENGEQFEVFSRGNTLQFGGSSILPLPNAHFFTGDQTNLPLRSASFGYSGREGVRTRVEAGSSWNSTGGALHEWMTGRSKNEFRGDWTVDAGWIEKRGAPLGGTLDYRAEGLYRGSLEGYYLDDDGPNRREILNWVDGATITDRNRNLARTENKVFLGKDTHLDITAFHAGDAAVYSEFFGGDYRDRKTPESSAYLHSGSDNVLFTVGARTNLDTFSYRDNRALADYFVEELPVATLQWLAQPIAMTPWETPIVLDASTEVGERRKNYDERFVGNRDPETTLRADQIVELSTPFALGMLSIRPFAETRLTCYDETVAGGSDSRLALTAGVSAGTRFQRTWRWTDDEGNEQGMRHVVSPRVTFADRYHVDGSPSDFYQYDATDAITEENLVRCEVRNLFQRMDGASGKLVTYDFVYLDLAQDLWPEAQAGQPFDPNSLYYQAQRVDSESQLGLFYYDFLIRPRAYWVPFENFSYGIYGDHDWQTGLRTFDTELQFGQFLGCNWTTEYRRDAVTNGAVGLGASTSFYGRWDVFGFGQYDAQENQFLRYGGALIRRDHDYSIRFGLDFDPYEDQLSFRIDFEPRLPGMSKPRERNWYGSVNDFQQRSATSF